MQYKKEVDVMLEVARSYTKNNASGGEIDTAVSPPADSS